MRKRRIEGKKYYFYRKKCKDCGNEQDATYDERICNFCGHPSLVRLRGEH